jgi:predicted ATPase
MIVTIIRGLPGSGKSTLAAKLSIERSMGDEKKSGHNIVEIDLLPNKLDDIARVTYAHMLKVGDIIVVGVLPRTSDVYKLYNAIYLCSLVNGKTELSLEVIQTHKGKKVHLLGLLNRMKQRGDPDVNLSGIHRLVESWEDMPYAGVRK